jgi:D-alanine-D-alanine ligase
MRIGITYDLRDDYLRQGYSEDETAEFDAPETIDAIEDALTSLGHITVRVGSIQNLAARLVARERWDLVFNHVEGLHGFWPRGASAGSVDAFGIPYTSSDALVMALALHKGDQPPYARHGYRDA